MWTSSPPQSVVASHVEAHVSGPRHNVYFAARDGVWIDGVEVRAVRTDRLDDTGLAVEGVSVAATPALTEATAALLRVLGYTGVGCAQYLSNMTQKSLSCFCLFALRNAAHLSLGSLRWSAAGIRTLVNRMLMDRPGFESRRRYRPAGRAPP